MTTSLRVYADDALSSEIYNPNVLQKTDGTTGPVDFTLHFGSVLAGKKIQALSNPGVDPIVLSVVDSAGVGAQPASSVKLALAASGLDAATAGASLELGTEVLSGADNAISVFVRVEAQTLSPGTYNDLSLATNELVETDA